MKITMRKKRERKKKSIARNLRGKKSRAKHFKKTLKWKTKDLHNVVQWKRCKQRAERRTMAGEWGREVQEEEEWEGEREGLEKIEDIFVNWLRRKGRGRM